MALSDNVIIRPAGTRAKSTNETKDHGRIRPRRRAQEHIEELSVDEVVGMVGRPDVVLFDVREQNERELEGVIPGAIHAPRGMLEFWADPSMDIHRPEFDTRKQIIVHCEMGWRGALAAATLLRMGFPKVANLAGGFAAWKAADRPIEPASTSPEAPAQRTSRRL